MEKGDDLEEEGITFATSKNVFYNPEMRFCRSMSSLAVGAIKEPLEAVDAFCASGIRGIRYAKENKNVKRITFIDIDQSAITLAKKNARANRLKSEAKKGNVSKLAFETVADFLEIDPFGTPSPYLVDSFRFFNPKKSAYLSATATDVAVLCGGKVAPCMKNYHAKPLNNEFTHETGLRILLKRIVETAAEFNMGVTPLISFSDRHYLKTILHVNRSADDAYDSLKKTGYVSWCRKCGWRGSGEFPQPCANCKSAIGSGVEFAGPLWLGELHEPQTLKKMAAFNKARGYSDKEQIARMLSLMQGEIGMPPYYYNVHDLCKMQKSVSVPKMDAVLEKLKAMGHVARRTHFSPLSIKTAAPYAALLDAIKG
jgi:tRNA (guanine26-N2/guanine27-N2)-dimethyltransferase